MGPDDTDWRCDGVAASGDEADCGGTPPGGTCEWIVLTGCEDHGVIADFCGPDRTLDKLRRCNGTCFRPNELYQAFSLCSCDTIPDSEVCAEAECDCAGPSWDAVYCCTG